MGARGIILRYAAKAPRRARDAPHVLREEVATANPPSNCGPSRSASEELETAARACRALAYQEEQAAKRMENPGMRGPVENTAKRAAALAEPFEAARKKIRQCAEGNIDRAKRGEL